MQQQIKRIASDPQCLKLITSVRASVASCLNTIGRNAACFKRLLADGLARAIRYRAHGFWHCQPSREKPVSATFWNAATSGHHTWVSAGVGFAGVNLTFSYLNLVEVYIIGFLKVCSLLWYKILDDSGCK